MGVRWPSEHEKGHRTGRHFMNISLISLIMGIASATRRGYFQAVPTCMTTSQRLLNSYSNSLLGTISEPSESHIVVWEFLSSIVLSISSSSVNLLPFSNFLSYPIRRYHQSNRWIQPHTKDNQPAVATKAHIPSALLSLPSSPHFLCFLSSSSRQLKKLDFLKSESSCCFTEMRHAPIGLLRISSRSLACNKLVAYAS